MPWPRELSLNKTMSKKWAKIVSINEDSPDNYKQINKVLNYATI